MAMARNFGGWLGLALSGRSGLDGAESDQAAPRPAQEVFPGLGFSLAAGLILGAAMGVGLAWLDESSRATASRLVPWWVRFWVRSWG